MGIIFEISALEDWQIIGLYCYNQDNFTLWQKQDNHNQNLKQFLMMVNPRNSIASYPATQALTTHSWRLISWGGKFFRKQNSPAVFKLVHLEVADVYSNIIMSVDMVWREVLFISLGSGDLNVREEGLSEEDHRFDPLNWRKN